MIRLNETFDSPLSGPTPDEIRAECAKKRTEWDEKTRLERKRRVDLAELKQSAHFRFLKFLVERAEHNKN